MENILKESEEFRMLFEKSQNLLAGMYSSKIKGEGIEFVDLREYLPGDDVRKIDWKVTARENKPFVKEFLEEKDASHYVLLDVSASMRNKFLSAKILATSLLMSSSKSRDSFSIGFFNEGGVRLFPLSKNKTQLMRNIYEISKVEFSSGGDLKEVLLKVLSMVNRKSIVSIISDELEFDSDINSLFSVMNRKHKLNYFHLFSSKEKDLEVGLNSFEDVETGEGGVYDLDEDEVRGYVEEFDRQIKFVEDNFLRLGIRPFVVDTDLDLSYQIRKRAEVI